MSLIELMVGLTLGLILIVASSFVFVGSRQASRSTDGLSRLQESARTVFEIMARDLRETGGTPCDNRPRVANVLNAAQGTPLWWADWNLVFQGYRGTDAAPGTSFGSAAGERVSGTEALTFKRVQDLTDLGVVAHDTATAVMTVNQSPHRVAAGDLLMACIYGQASIFAASAVGATTISHTTAGGSADNCSRGLGIPTACTATGTTYSFAPGGKVGRLIAATWYIGANGRPQTGGRSLYRVTRAGAEEVAEGIQDLQLRYLQTGNADYVDAGAVTNWAMVVAVRVQLTLRSADTGTATSADSRLQRTMGFTLHLRNRQS